MASDFFVQYFDGWGNYGFHSHDKNELVLIRHGTVSIRTEKEFFIQKAPCCILYKKDRPHIQQNSNIGKYERYCIQFDQKYVSGLPIYDSLFLFSNADAICIPLTDETLKPFWSVSKILQNIYEQNKSNDIRAKLLISYILAEINEIYEASSFHSVSPVLAEPYLSSVLRYISAHLTEKITIDSVALKFGIGRTKLTSDFRKIFSTSFCEYVTLLRLELAREMLNDGVKCAEIAQACGFGDSSYFVKVFKKHYGCTPYQYRRNNGQSIEG